MSLKDGTAWCPWCRRQGTPISHVGPGLYCQHCGWHLGNDSQRVFEAKPSTGRTEPIVETNPQPELVLA